MMRTEGAVVGDRYRLGPIIGEGGHGAVYRGTDLTVGRDVAIKLLHRERGATDALEARFEQEATLARKLQHPNTVRMLDVGRTGDGALFIVYELLTGNTLADVLAAERGMTEPRVRHIGGQVLKSLMEAHASGFVHRDIKPANIFLCNIHGEADFVKVIDFGIAKEVEVGKGITRTGFAVGTPSYMAPEQVRGDQVDAATDVYAVGLVLAEALAGSVVMTGTTAAVIAAAQLSSEPVPLPPRVLQSPLGPIIHRATQKERERRYPNAEEMLSELMALDLTMPAGAAKTGVLPAGTGATPPTQVSGAQAGKGKPPSGKGLWIGLAALSLLLMVGVVGVVTMASPDSSTQTDKPKEKSRQRGDEKKKKQKTKKKKKKKKKPKPLPEPATRFPDEVKRINAYVFDDERPGQADTDFLATVDHVGGAHSFKPLSREEKTALFNLFKRLKAHTAKAKHRGLFRVVNRAIVEIADPRWEDDLIAMLEVPVASMKTSEQKPLMDQVFWQVTAAQTLGKLQSEKAIKPLIAVTLSPFKGNIAMNATTALVRIGGPVVKPATDLLEGRDAVLQSYADKELRRSIIDHGYPVDAKIEKEAKHVYRRHAVLILSNLGIEEAKAPLLAATNHSDKQMRQRAATGLSRLPYDPALLAAFKRVYEETTPSDKLLDRAYAKEALISSAIRFFEPGLAAYFIKEAETLTGKKNDIIGVKAEVFQFAVKQADAKTWPEVEKIFNELAPRARGDDLKYYRDPFDAAKALVAKCADRLACYESVLASGAKGHEAVRAAHQVVILGGEGKRAVIVEHALEHDDVTVRSVMQDGVVRLSPKGNAAALAKIDVFRQEALDSNNFTTRYRAKVLDQVAAVLRRREDS